MSEGFAAMLRALRARRRWSQEHLGLESGVSPRHISCLETGKARPSRETVLVLASGLALELRERNALLVSAGFVAVYPTTPLGDDAMGPVRRAIDLLLAHHEPYPALVIDRCWNVVQANAGARRLLTTFLEPTVVTPRVQSNLARATLHPDGLRPHVQNWHEVAASLLDRIERAHHEHPLDADRRALLDEVCSYPGIPRLAGDASSTTGPAATVHLRRGEVDLRIFVLLTTIGTPIDVTAQDLCVESFFPLDDATARWFRA